MSWRYRYEGYYPYVSVSQRQAKAQTQVKKLLKKGLTPQPIELAGRKIASSFWGKAWCQNLESYMDYENRLPRGRSYVRNGLVLHLEIKPGQIQALVSGTSLYQVNIQISSLPAAKWKALCKKCAGEIGSLIELLSGKLSNQVMSVMTQKDTGLFPAPSEISLDCTCPDWATLCKHVAAVLYGVGARLDSQPELLFVLRNVDQNELISQAVGTDITASDAAATATTLADADVSDVFGIDLAMDQAPPSQPAPTKPPRKTASKKPAVQKTAVKKTAPKKTEKKKVAKMKVSPPQTVQPQPVPAKKGPAPATQKAKPRGWPRGSKNKKS